MAERGVVILLAVVAVVAYAVIHRDEANAPREADHANAQSRACRKHRAGLPPRLEAPPPRRVVALGRRLFNDRRLSADRTVSCQSCHDPSRSFTDGRRVSLGIQRRSGTRNAPTLEGISRGSSFLWDGRAKSIAESASRALHNPNEMDMTSAEIEERLIRETDRFLSSVRAPPSSDSVSHVLAAYVSTLHGRETRVDRYLFCGEATLNRTERSGLQLFTGQASCTVCHTIAHAGVHPFGGEAAAYTDFRFHNTGAGRSRDPGRGGVTKRREDYGAFKTPTLRDIARTAPYMHDGSLKTLTAVVRFYNRGGVRNPGLDRNIRPLHLSAGEERALVAFLRALSSPAPRQR
jgi:cytochrome c peroxidase